MRTTIQLLEYSDNIRILEAAAHCGCISERQTQQFIHAYCHYRGLYHVPSLRNQEKMVAKIELQDEIAPGQPNREQLFAAPK